MENSYRLKRSRNLQVQSEGGNRQGLPDRDIYFGLMRETSAEVLKYLGPKLKAVGDAYGMTECLEFFTRKRAAAGLLLKPLLARFSYEFAGGTEWRKTIPLGAAIELLNVSSYQANSAFDQKYGCISKQDQDNQIIAAMVSRELAEEIIIKEYGDSADTNRLLALVAEINKHIYIGQFFELNTLRWASLSNQWPDMDAYQELYLQKCFHISGVFSRDVALLGASLASPNPSVLKSLHEFGEHYGVGLNIINDLADYLPPESDLNPVYKIPGDQFNDLRSGRVFFPIYLALNHATEADKAMLVEVLEKRMSLTPEIMRSIIRILASTKSLRSTFLLAKKEMVLAKIALRHSGEPYTRSLLAIMASAIKTNKFVWYYRKSGLF